jgi:hypothetical protein
VSLSQESSLLWTRRTAEKEGKDRSASNVERERRLRCIFELERHIPGMLGCGGSTGLTRARLDDKRSTLRRRKLRS